jgi:hypothetical protein
MLETRGSGHQLFGKKLDAAREAGVCCFGGKMKSKAVRVLEKSMLCLEPNFGFGTNFFSSTTPP